MTPQPIILFDTEYTSWEGAQARKWSGPGEHREIIQLAALRVDVNAHVSELASFDRLIRPRINPRLSAYIINLTGIQQADVDAAGMPFPAAFAAFYDFCGRGALPMFCWGDDPGVLAENFRLNDLPPAAFPAGIYDIRGAFQQAGIDTRPYTSGTVHQAVDVKFNQAAHNALNDVRSLSATLRYLTQAGRLTPDRLYVGRFPV